MKIRLCAVTTRAMTMRSFMVDTLNTFAENDFEITAICEPNDAVKAAFSPKIKYFAMKMKSGIVNPLSVVNIIVKMVLLFRRGKYDVIQYASTNAGLYAAIAAKICRIPVRIFCQWGMMYVGSTGIRRWIYKTIEKIICMLSTNVQSDSPSNAEYAVSEGIVKREKIEVIWNGSSTGVDTERFYPISKESLEYRTLREQFGIPKDAYVFGFIGRINKEKGVGELLDAFREMKETEMSKRAELVIVGPMECDKDLNEKLDHGIDSQAGVHYYGMKEDVRPFYHLMDCFVLPSYREGIATVLLEACASGLPILSSNILGSVDVVENDTNGFLFEPRNITAIEDALRIILTLSDEELVRLSHNSRRIAIERFDHDILCDYLLQDRIEKYNRIQKKRNDTL